MKKQLFVHLATLAIFILQPFFTVAQPTSYARAVTYNGANPGLNEEVNSESAMAFNAFESKLSVAANLISKKYPGLSKFNFEINDALAHTFFHQNGNRVQVVFNKKNRLILEIQDLAKQNFPPSIIKEVAFDYPNSRVLVIKRIISLQSNYYEVLIERLGEMVKLEMAGF